MARRHVSGRDVWAGNVAAAWAERLEARPTLRHVPRESGSTPLPVYARMAATPAAFAGGAVLLLDEFGGLAPDEPARCDRVLRDHLVDRVRPATYRSIDTAAGDLAGECAGIDEWIDDGGIDLAVVGLGSNGHIGMNEPGSAVAGRTARVELAPSTVEGAARSFGGRTRPTWGVTVGSRRSPRRPRGVGAGDRGGQGSDRRPLPPRTPVRRTRRRRCSKPTPRCTWWLDEDAAG